MADWSPCSGTKAVGVCVQRGLWVGTSHRKVLKVWHLDVRVKSYI